MNDKFRVNSYQLNAQRHIYPLYIRDGRGGYLFSSTMTFVTFMNQPFCVFAAHALPPNTQNLDQIGIITIDGDFMPLSEIEVSHEICRIRDLVACQTIAPFEHKNYFNLDTHSSTTEFSKNFAWIGFPKKKAIQTIDKSKASNEQIKEYLTDGVDGLKKWNNADFLLLGVEQISETEMELTGIHDNKNVEYEHEGFKQKGYSLKGMSGGAFFRGPMNINSSPKTLSDLYDFAGIGLEYINDKIVKGASKHSVQELLRKVLGLHN